MASTQFRDVASVVGVGRTELSTRSGRTTLSLAIEAITRAVADAGLSMSDIDGLALHAASDCAPLHEVATTLGLRTVRWFHEEWGGGSKAPVILASAASACATGDATNVVIFRALNGRSGMRMGRAGPGASAAMPRDLQYQVPYGIVAPAQSYAMAARMHMNRFGTTQEAFGTIAVQQRANASLNSRALMRDPMTMDDYLASRWIVEPFHLFDCCLETDGACAIVLSTTERARDLAQPPVTVRGWASAIGPNGISNIDGDLTTTTGAQVAPHVYAMAGLGPADVDVAELYDAFTYSVLVQLEDYGFCAKGDGGPYVLSGATARDGALPVNTHGGFLSEGYVHGMNNIAEAVDQLRGQAGERQVPGCQVALVTGQPGYITGMSSAVMFTRP